MANLTEKSINVLEYVRTHEGADNYYKAIAAALGMEDKSVNGVLTGLAKKGLVERVPATIEEADGTTKAVKFAVATEEGLAWTAPACDECAE